MSGTYTIALLILSNIFMTLAWYGHLKLQQTGTSLHWPLIGVIAFSWAIAFFEYCCQVPANRIGFVGNGGPFSLVQLKVIPGMRQPYCFRRHRPLYVPGRSLAMEPLAGILFSHSCRLSGIQVKISPLHENARTASP